jgi:hypothetical protein
MTPPVLLSTRGRVAREESDDSMAAVIEFSFAFEPLYGQKIPIVKLSRRERAAAGIHV